VDPNCSQTWLLYTDYRSTTSGYRGRSTDAESCLAECIADSRCVFVDHIFSANPQQCWIHVNADHLRQVARAVGYNQYVLVRRCTTSNCEYSKSVNKAQIPLGSSRHDSTRLTLSSESSRSAGYSQNAWARHVERRSTRSTKSNVSSRVETSQVEFGPKQARKNKKERLYMYDACNQLGSTR